MSKPLVGTSIVAARLDVSPRTLTDWCRDKKIPHKLIGGLYKFDEDEIEAWLADHSVGARA